MDIRHLPPQAILERPAAAEAGIAHFHPCRVQVTDDLRYRPTDFPGDLVGPLVGAGEAPKWLVGPHRPGGAR